MGRESLGGRKVADKGRRFSSPLIVVSSKVVARGSVWVMLVLSCLESTSNGIVGFFLR